MNARISWLALAVGLTLATPANAQLQQPDGAVIPAGNALANVLNSPPLNEGIDVRQDASLVPEVFTPANSLTFDFVAEGAGFENAFGWYNLGDDISQPGNRHVIFGCEIEPEQPFIRVEVDFCRERAEGRWNGGPIGFFLITPQRVDGGSRSPNCAVNDNVGYIYYSEPRLNLEDPDNPFIHHLVYRSNTFENAFYFGFEDLFRGGDNDFEDTLVLVQGLLVGAVPELCDGADDDCDGRIDEGADQVCETACGVGARVCGDGELGACTAPLPVDETCNGIDDDCDGELDEGLVRDCVNACGDGVEVCLAGDWVGCTAPRPGDERCDNVDNDCDGIVDEGLVEACQNGCGVAGEAQCRAGRFVDCDAPQPVVEICNGVDDDCDGEADERLVEACEGPCGGGLARCVDGVFVDCSAPQPAEEQCNGADDDCDGEVDEQLVQACESICGDVGEARCVGGVFVACSARQPTPELCNGRDDDCDGEADEALDRACQNACGEGQQICEGGAWSACDAPPPEPEVCDGVDQDCDGDVDEALVTPCRSPCGDGVQQCVLGAFEACDAPIPEDETCNGVDDDCDGALDEGLERPCDSACGIGTEVCVEGEWLGCTAQDPIEEACNGLDDDCDGALDETLVRPCQTPCGEGMQQCEAGRWTACPVPDAIDEICNGGDDDCDGLTDEVAPCAGEAACIRGVCALPCQFGECPPGQDCTEDDFCVPQPCQACRRYEICQADTCTDPCAGVECAAGTYCRSGECIVGDCFAGGCEDGRACVGGECVPDDCDLQNCGRGQACRLGACVATCLDADCDDDQRCLGGMCQPDPCAGVECGDGAICADASCMPDPCADIFCGQGRLCFEGACLDDPCLTTRCPDGTECAVDAYGEVDCRWPVDDEPIDVGVDGGGPVDAGADADPGGATTTDGCSAAPGSTPPSSGWILLILALGLVPRRARLRVGACALAMSGCVESTDVAPGEDGSVMIDPGCFPTDEVCNGQDDDCDGRIDEVPDRTLDRDPDNCGACGAQCDLPNAIPGCLGGRCRIDRCAPGFDDEDGDSSNGCESQCEPRNDGVEVCNGDDDDCDGAADEGFDLGSDVDHCGVCGRACLTAGVAEAECVGGRCSIQACEPGRFNLDGLPENGCEYDDCGTPGADEVCNGEDDDCDGVADEALTADIECRGEGLCRGARPECRGEGGFVCNYVEGVTEAGETLCDGRDEDCDGTVDEDFAGLGEACDGDDEDVCANGTTICNAARDGTTCREVRRGREICDGADNDCDEAIDEDFDLTTDDENCGRCGLTCNAANARGSCAASACVIDGCAPGFVDLDGLAVTGCEYPCAGSADAAEACNGEDDDCDGRIDEGVPLPEGDFCLDVGVCTGTLPVCLGPRGFVCVYAAEYSAEDVDVCDGLDNDCDGQTDEDYPRLGDICDGPDEDDCPGGIVACREGGDGVLCTDDEASLDEICDGSDNDCDGFTDEGFDLNLDVDNCGTCNTRCGRAGAETACLGGECTLVGCQPGFFDLNGLAVDGCEYACADVPGAEVCDGIDNDCNGLVDDGLPPPPLQCAGPGLCTGLQAACAGAEGFACPFPVAHEPIEITCDDLDNDCDGEVDEGSANLALVDKGQPCRAGRGACLRRGVLTCDEAGQALVCTATAGDASPESCNGIDDDCDGTIDEGIPRLEEMVQVDVAGRSVWIDRFEASRPDATADQPGLDTGRACSRPGVIPWANVTFDEAQAACRARGKRLCTDAEWTRGCGNGFPYGDAFAPDTCNTAGPGLATTGAFAGCIGPDGINDMSGNLAEWADCANPVDCRVVRPVLGGSFGDAVERQWRCDFRGNGAPGTPSGTVGFRCCADD